MSHQHKLYTDFADWWHLLSRVEDYAEEAAIYSQALKTHTRRPIDTVLELGSGGGNNAFHMKASFEMTLVDLSEAMLVQSRSINPACEHHTGDIRTVPPHLRRRLHPRRHRVPDNRCRVDYRGWVY